MDCVRPETLDELGAAVLGYREPASGVWMIFARPETRPDLWSQYLRGLERVHRAHGTERAIDLPAIFAGRRLPMFAAALGESGAVLAGVRAHGPLRDPAEAHALVEYASYPAGQRSISRLVGGHIGAGVAELKGGWVAADAPRRREVAAALARSFLHIMAILGVEHAFCTTADHAARRWQAVGGRTVEGLAPVCYPDARYRTTMLWWTRADYARHCDAAQLARIRAERTCLAPLPARAGEGDPARAGDDRLAPAAGPSPSRRGPADGDPARADGELSAAGAGARGA
ncbi:MAG: hypothetical protein LBQ06_04370 [Frankiaceae bacterium]|jgi:hypothetical protein|nr:hypothetical protein [Frankiaceae bacterium]